jgi:serine/threonine protein kinase
MLKENIIHKNLKPNNILISLEKLDKNIIKLSDYGSSKEINNTMNIAEMHLIMSPEVLNGEEYLSKTDLWSLGIIIYYMYFKEYPYNGNNEVSLLNDINSGKQLKSIDNQELNDLRIY